MSSPSAPADERHETDPVSDNPQPVSAPNDANLLSRQIFEPPDGVNPTSGLTDAQRTKLSTLSATRSLQHYWESQLHNIRQRNERRAAEEAETEAEAQADEDQTPFPATESKHHQTKKEEPEPFFKPDLNRNTLARVWARQQTPALSNTSRLPPSTQGHPLPPPSWARKPPQDLTPSEWLQHPEISARRANIHGSAQREMYAAIDAQREHYEAKLAAHDAAAARAVSDAQAAAQELWHRHQNEQLRLLEVQARASVAASNAARDFSYSKENQQSLRQHAVENRRREQDALMEMRRGHAREQEELMVQMQERQESMARERAQGQAEWEARQVRQVRQVRGMGLDAHRQGLLNVLSLPGGQPPTGPRGG